MNWICRTCTFVNENENFLTCSICNTLRQETQKKDLNEETSPLEEIPKGLMDVSDGEFSSNSTHETADSDSLEGLIKVPKNFKSPNKPNNENEKEKEISKKVISPPRPYGFLNSICNKVRSLISREPADGYQGNNNKVKIKLKIPIPRDLSPDKDGIHQKVLEKYSIKNIDAKQKNEKQKYVSKKTKKRKRERQEKRKHEQQKQTHSDYSSNNVFSAPRLTHHVNIGILPPPVINPNSKFRCLDCWNEFFDMSKCSKHLASTMHMDFAASVDLDRFCTIDNQTQSLLAHIKEHKNRQSSKRLHQPPLKKRKLNNQQQPPFKLSSSSSEIKNNQNLKLPLHYQQKHHPYQQQQNNPYQQQPPSYHQNQPPLVIPQMSLSKNLRPHVPPFRPSFLPPHHKPIHQKRPLVVSNKQKNSEKLRKKKNEKNKKLVSRPPPLGVAILNDIQDKAKNGQLNHIVLVDLDNWGCFFKKLPVNFPPGFQRTFILGFHNGNFHVPKRHCPGFTQFTNFQRRGYVELKKCCMRKDSADFNICVRLGQLDILLGIHIPISVLSGDCGFKQIESSDTRRDMYWVCPREYKNGKGCSKNIDDDVVFATLLSIGDQRATF